VEPAVIVRNSKTGLGVFAAKPLNPMTRTVQFSGPVSAIEDVPAQQLNYILRASRDLYLTPETDARYVNHSCDPNCYIDNDLYIVTRYAIPEGTELTISYNRISETEARDWGNFWHQAWSFQCRCGSDRCYGLINKYITDEVTPYAEPVTTRIEPKNVTK
jgi:SET domain-containing protein